MWTRHSESTKNKEKNRNMTRIWLKRTNELELLEKIKRTQFKNIRGEQSEGCILDDKEDIARNASMCLSVVQSWNFPYHFLFLCSLLHCHCA